VRGVAAAGAAARIEDADGEHESEPRAFHHPHAHLASTLHASDEGGGSIGAAGGGL
jgi:hypothetical protein